MVGIRNPDGWNPESRWLESGIQRVGIRNPEGWNPESKGLESGIQTVGIRNPEGWNPESKWLESGIQMVGIRNPRPLWILLRGATQDRPQPVVQQNLADLVSKKIMYNWLNCRLQPTRPATTSRTAKFGRPSVEKNNVQLA